jgi:hypothetical protein
MLGVRARVGCISIVVFWGSAFLVDAVGDSDRLRGSPGEIAPGREAHCELRCGCRGGGPHSIEYGGNSAAQSHVASGKRAASLK